MFDLYFRDNKRIETLVRKGIELGGAMRAIDQDLKKRRPKFISYYKRCWEDNDGNYWIDYGSHSEFYILRSENNEGNQD